MSKLILIKDDKDHTLKMTSLLSKAKNNVEKAIQLYNEMTGEPLKPEQYSKFMTGATVLIHSVLKSKLDVPPGFDRDKYFELTEKPHTAHIEMLLTCIDNSCRYKTEYCTTQFISYDGAKVELTEAAHKAITANNVYLTEPQHKIYKEVHKFIEMANKMTALHGAGYNGILNQQVMTYLSKNVDGTYTINETDLASLLRQKIK